MSLGIALKSFNKAEEDLAEVIALTEKSTKAEAERADTIATLFKMGADLCDSTVHPPRRGHRLSYEQGYGSFPYRAEG